MGESISDFIQGLNLHNCVRHREHLISMSKHCFKDVNGGLDVANDTSLYITKGVFDPLATKTDGKEF